ncbi:diacylglycerol/lipid kinase family protein [Angustibacter sp. McL0619]|uniref:diacylglycerol/lipid kinase family protein n=1 Tax=Angustibacter sp. McL0619 TaxID=3415676 RepID=UPI003CE9621F
MTVQPISLLIAAVVVVAAFAVLGVLVVRYRRRLAELDPEPVQDDRTRRAAVIINPTKFDDLDAVREQVTKVCRAQGWAEPLFLETTEDDHGAGQAKQALDEGVDLVCPLGGDGTVREVASAMVHTGVPLGLLPGGTGNLLARNLELPLDSVDDALTVALRGVDQAIDVGIVEFDSSGEDEGPDSRVFLVMAGLGFDAQMMAGTPEKLKARFGWLAYAVSGARHITGPRAKARIVADDQSEFTRRVRTVLVGNCGTLTGGIRLIPDAEVDDGWLDVVTLSPKGVVSWASVAARVLTRRGHHRVERIRCRTLEVRVDRPTEAQLDGDVVGQVRALRARVDPGALLIRLPANRGRG